MWLRWRPGRGRGKWRVRGRVRLDRWDERRGGGHDRERGGHDDGDDGDERRCHRHDWDDRNGNGHGGRRDGGRCGNDGHERNDRRRDCGDPLGVDERHALGSDRRHRFWGDWGNALGSGGGHGHRADRGGDLAHARPAYAVLGLSETLTQELAGGPIRVSCVVPGGIRTNIVRNARGMSETDVAAFAKIARTSAETAAQTIVRGIERNKEQIYVGLDAKVLAAAKRIAPRWTVRRTAKVMRRIER